VDVVPVARIVGGVVAGAGDVVAAGHTDPPPIVRVFPDDLLEVGADGQQVVGEPLHVGGCAHPVDAPVQPIGIRGETFFGPLAFLVAGIGGRFEVECPAKLVNPVGKPGRPVCDAATGWQTVAHRSQLR